MKVTMLLENTVCRDDVKCAHGLSMYIETQNHKILFDMGPNAMFLENAETLGVNIADADIAVLSHAHNDHCGGLELFCKRNDHAKIYLQQEVWG
ncbi:MAG: MBL fold metallo-hydrolase, partial [Oscillospiraceae bacterium]|nr:MBL fold metallo-hydrolase [Oscillospiraceae bacterium]